jgi:undecaprenyl-diphosphatase
MSVLQSFVLGVVQGLTEFLPISSTAHLRAVPALLGWDDPGVAYSAVIQLGSIIAVIAYFWKDLIGIAGGSIKALREKNLDSQDLRVATGIIVGTIPICVIGLLLKNILEEAHGPFRSLYIIGGASVVMGMLLLLAEKLASHKRTIENVGVRDGLLVGLGQCMALIPGCSRSGSTLTVAMFLGLKRDDAARYSFLLGIPAITLAGLLELKEMFKTPLESAAMTDLIVGLLTSLVVSYLSIAWLLKYLSKHSTWVFVAYRLVFGIAVLVLASMNYIR